MELKPEHYKNHISFEDWTCSDDCMGLSNEGRQNACCRFFNNKGLNTYDRNIHGECVFSRCISCIIFFNEEPIAMPSYVSVEHVEKLKEI